MCKFCKNKVANAKTSISLLLNAFFSKNDVNGSETCFFCAKNAFYAHYRFRRNESTGNVQTH